MEDIVIVGAARTAIGKFGGTLAKMPAADMGALVIKDVLRRAGVAPEQVSEVILGQVLTAGVGQNPARQASIRAGLPDMVPAMTINMVCGSGLRATHLAAQAIKAGDAEIVVAGGQESMSLSQHVMMGSRDGFRMGDAKLVDSMINDGLWDIFNNYHMGTTAENVAKQFGISRQEQDEFAAASQQKDDLNPLQKLIFGHVIVEAEILRQLIYGLALILVMLYRPKGIWPEKTHHVGEVKS